MPKEIQKMCATCGKGENHSTEPCPTRPGCFTPDYINWVEPGEEKEDTRCTNCYHWKVIKIGKFCPDCGQILK